MDLHVKRLGTGSPVFILHGLYGSGSNWHSIANKLSKYCEVFLVDQRNHGESPHHPEFNYQVLTKDIIELLDKLNIDKASIIGHSMGGKVAMNVALNYPNRVDRLIVIDIALRGYLNQVSNIPSVQNLVHEKIITSLANLDIEYPETREEIDKQLARSLPQKAIRQFLLKNLKRNKAGDFYWGLNLEAVKNNLHHIMEAIETDEKHFNNNAMMIKGLMSEYILAPDVEEFKQVFPNLTYKELDTGHWVHAEKPRELLQLMQDFLSGKL